MSDTPRVDKLNTSDLSLPLIDRFGLSNELARQLERELNELKAACAETPTRAELLDQNRRLKFRISVLEDRDEMARQLVKLEKEVERHQPELCDEIRMERDRLKELYETFKEHPST